jgi:hypothetical protein
MAIAFERKDYPTIMSGLVVRYHLKSDSHDGEITASRDGVSIHGCWPIMRDLASIDEVVTTLRKAQVHAMHLAGAYSGLIFPRVEALSEEVVERAVSKGQ